MHTGGVYALVSYNRRQAAEDSRRDDRTAAAAATPPAGAASERPGQSPTPAAPAVPAALLRRLLPTRDEVIALLRLLPLGLFDGPAPAGCFFKSKASPPPIHTQSACPFDWVD